MNGLGLPIQMLNGIAGVTDLYRGTDDIYTTMGCPDCGGTCNQIGVPPTITFNSKPTSDWKCEEWMIWHKLLVQAFMAGSFKSGIKYSKQKAIELANQVFIQWWKDTVSWFSYNYSFCGYGSDFLSYFKSVGLTDHISALAATVTPIVSTAPKVADATEKIVTNTADAAVKTTGVAKWLVPGILIFAAGGVGYFMYKNYLKGDKKIKVGPAQLGNAPRKKSKRKSSKKTITI